MKGENVIYKVILLGCDDATYVEIELDSYELDAVMQLARLVNDESSYACMPSMSILLNDKILIEK